jgi:hypothetical protein
MQGILNECVEEFANCNLEDIINYAFTGKVYVGSYPVDKNQIPPDFENEDTEDITINEGTIKYDIRFTVTVPHSDEEITLIINVEAQNDQYLQYELVTRAIYYCSRMISAQKESVFINSDYQKIRKVYSIWLCMNPPNKEKDSITRYDMTEKLIQGCVTRPKKSFDLQSVIMIYLGEAYRDNYSGIIGLLSPLLSNKMPQSEKSSVLEEKYGIAMTKDLERSVSTMCNLSKGVWEDGIQSGLIQAIKNLMDNADWTIEQAMKMVGISEDEQPLYKEKLEK